MTNSLSHTLNNEFTNNNSNDNNSSDGAAAISISSGMDGIGSHKLNSIENMTVDEDDAVSGGGVIMEKKIIHTHTNTNNVRYLHSSSSPSATTTTTIIKQSPISPVPLNSTSTTPAASHSHRYHTQHSINESMFVAAQIHDSATNISDKLELSNQSQQQQQHQLNTHSRLSQNNNNNNSTNTNHHILNASAHSDNNYIGQSMVGYARHKHDVPLPLTTSMAACQLTSCTAGNGDLACGNSTLTTEPRPPPPPYHTIMAGEKLYHPTNNSNTSCQQLNEMDTLTSPEEVIDTLSGTRLSAYEQFLKLSAQEYTTVTADNTASAALNLSSTAMEAAAADVTSNSTGVLSKTNSIEGMDVVNGQTVILSVLTREGGGNSISSVNEFSSRVVGNIVCERN